MLKKLSFFTLLFLLGGSVYAGLELLYRKRTHISMFITGGICLVIIHIICNIIKPFCRLSRFIKAIVCGIVITVVEFVVGIYVNILKKLCVWDYSKLNFNYLGQICPQFTILWIILSLPAIFLTEHLYQRSLMKNEKASVICAK